MAALGTEAPLKGEKFTAVVSGDCISKTALRHSDSLGIRILAMMPTSTAFGVLVKAPACSIQPPMNARPFVKVERNVPKKKVIESRRMQHVIMIAGYASIFLLSCDGSGADRWRRRATVRPAGPQLPHRRWHRVAVVCGRYWHSERPDRANRSACAVVGATGHRCERHGRRPRIYRHAWPVGGFHPVQPAPAVKDLSGDHNRDYGRGEHHRAAESQAAGRVQAGV